MPGRWCRSWVREPPLWGEAAPILGRGLSSKCLPTAGELAAFLATVSVFPSEEEYDRGDLAKVSSYYAEIMGRTRLRQFTQGSTQLRSQARSIAPASGRTGRRNEIIVSTNYDTLIEQAFQEAGKPYDLVVYPTDKPELANSVMWWRHGEPKPDFVAPNSLAGDLTKKSLIYKMHGTAVPRWRV